MYACCPGRLFYDALSKRLVTLTALPLSAKFNNTAFRLNSNGTCFFLLERMTGIFRGVDLTKNSNFLKCRERCLKICIVDSVVIFWKRVKVSFSVLVFLEFSVLVEN